MPAAERWAGLVSDALDALEAALFDAPHWGHRYCPEALLLAVRLLGLWPELRWARARGAAAGPPPGRALFAAARPVGRGWAV